MLCYCALIGADIWTLLFWRGLLCTIGMVGITLFLDRPHGLRRLVAIGRPELLVIVVNVCMHVLFVFAILNTTVANVLVIMSISPLLGATLSRFALGEPVAKRTWYTTVAVFIGLALIFSQSLGDGTLVGDLSAFAVAILLASNFVLLRCYRKVSMIPAVAWSMAVTAVITWFLATPTSLDGTAWVYVLLLGLVILPVSSAMITLGPRYLPAPEVGLIMLLETLLGPLWVWLVIREVPSSRDPYRWRHDSRRVDMDVDCSNPRKPTRYSANTKMKSGFTQRFAVPIIALSSLLVSVNGLMLRSIESASDWQIVFGRQLCFTPVMLLLLWIRYRGQLINLFRQLGWVGIGAGTSLGLANITIILAMSHTTIANALFTLSACPLITAILARVFLKEPIARATVVAIAVAMVGIVIMVADGLGSGTPFGNLIALACATFFSLFVIFLRSGKDRNMLPASVVGGLIGISIGLTVSGFDYVLSVHDFVICFLWGGIITSAVHFLFVVGSRHVPGAEIMLITLIEFTLGPVWVWLAFGEQPTRTALLGGALVLSSVAGRSIFLMQQRAATTQGTT